MICRGFPLLAVLAVFAFYAPAAEAQRTWSRGQIFTIVEHQRTGPVVIGYVMPCENTSGVHRYAELRVGSSGAITHRGWIGTNYKHPAWTSTHPVWLSGEDRYRVIRDHTPEGAEHLDWHDFNTYRDKVQPTGSMYPTHATGHGVPHFNQIKDRLKALCNSIHH